MRVKLWGARGSLPSFGPENTRYGGNTACIEIRGQGDELLVIDAGTGIRRLGEALGPEANRVDLLLTHLHMDHLIGLGFFEPLYDSGAVVRVWAPGVDADHLRAEVNRYLSPPLFPVRLRDLPGALEFRCVPRGTFSVGPFEIRSDYVCHPGPTVGYRVEEAGATLCFLPDHEPALSDPDLSMDPQWTSGFDLAAGAHLLIHDAQYDSKEYRAHVGWGHCSVLDAARFASAVGAKRLVTFHHDPAHDDIKLDEMIQSVSSLGLGEVAIAPGLEGAHFVVSPDTATPVRI